MPVRQTDDGHREIRMIDVTAKFYLTVAVIMFCGLRGIKREKGLPGEGVPLLPEGR